jgi:hypothetical protein
MLSILSNAILVPHLSYPLLTKGIFLCYPGF